MKKLFANAVIVAVSAAIAAPAFAGPTDDPVVQRRERRQERRIEQGERSGRLTPREAARLDREQTKIKRIMDARTCPQAKHAREAKNPSVKMQ